MDTNKPLKVGDRVKVITGWCGTNNVGDTGTLIAVDGSGLPYYVEFDNGARHWMKPNELKRVDDAPARWHSMVEKPGDKWQGKPMLVMLADGTASEQTYTDKHQGAFFVEPGVNWTTFGPGSFQQTSQNPVVAWREPEQNPNSKYKVGQHVVVKVTEVEGRIVRVDEDDDYFPAEIEIDRVTYWPKAKDIIVVEEE